jgi:catechol 2,3-dioxygenase-like lactoylglutathione lyase family enzyme
MTTAPTLNSLLLASADAERLQAWYVDVLGGELDPDGFLHFGSVAVLITPRGDVGPSTAEPGRVILNYTVTDIAATVRRLDEHAVTWIAPVEYRQQGGAWFATLQDPDGNYVQLIQLTAQYWAQRRARHQGSPLARAVLRDAGIGVRLPAQDLTRARTFYAERLGLDPAEEREGGLRYQCAGDSFVIFSSTGRPSGEHTQMGFYVPDIEVAVAELRDRGLTFDEVEIPGVRGRNGIVDIPGNYPSTGSVGERAVWFRDSEGNLLGLGQLVMPGTPDADRMAIRPASGPQYRHE